VTCWAYSPALGAGSDARPSTWQGSYPRSDLARAEAEAQGCEEFFVGWVNRRPLSKALASVLSIGELREKLADQGIECPELEGLQEGTVRAGLEFLLRGGFEDAHIEDVDTVTATNVEQHRARPR
jgi:hypothetical protein